MTTKSRLYLGVAALAIAVVLTGSVVEVSAQQSAPPAVAIDNDDIGGVVTGASGPEAGVWVIAETTDLPTRYAKMVVTDIGVMPLDHDLAPARQLRAAEMTNIRRCLRRRAGITGMEDVGHDSISRARPLLATAALQRKSAEKAVSRPRVSGNILRRMAGRGHAQLRRRSMDSAFISADNRRSDLESRRRPPGRSPEAQSGRGRGAT